VQAVVGSGPAGLAAALQTAFKCKAKLLEKLQQLESVVIQLADEFGTLLLLSPRHVVTQSLP
jgi:thioredoxin reductase